MRERDGELPEFLFAQDTGGGRLRPAGSASRGLDSQRQAELLEHLAAREVPRRRPGARLTRWAAPGIELIVDAHGSPAGPVRDRIIRSFEVV
jgi:hypothetical protein